MKGDALRELAEMTGKGLEPTNMQARAAIVEGIDILLGFGSLGERMTIALETIAKNTAIEVDPPK